MPDEYILRNLKWNYPKLVEKAYEIRDYGPFELLILIENERPIVYDDLNKYIRTLPRDSRFMSENECRNEFGIRMRKYMQVTGINQTILSNKTGLTQCTISKYANGEITPSIYNATKIANALGCSIDDLMYTGLEEN